MMHKSQIDILPPEPKLNSEQKADGLSSAKLLPSPLLAEALVHFGSVNYNKSLVKPIINNNWMKPKGGLWTSPINSKWGWKDWCECEGFRDCNEGESFKLMLNADAKIFLIDSLKDLVKAPLVEVKIGEHYQKQYLDFELLAKSYDAIWLTEKVKMKHIYHIR